MTRPTTPLACLSLLVKQLDELGSVDEDTLGFAKEVVKSAGAPKNEERAWARPLAYVAAVLLGVWGTLMWIDGFYGLPFGATLAGFCVFAAMARG